MMFTQGKGVGENRERPKERCGRKQLVGGIGCELVVFFVFFGQRGFQEGKGGVQSKRQGGPSLAIRHKGTGERDNR